MEKTIEKTKKKINQELIEDLKRFKIDQLIDLINECSANHNDITFFLKEKTNKCAYEYVSKSPHNEDERAKKSKDVWAFIEKEDNNSDFNLLSIVRDEELKTESGKDAIMSIIYSSEDLSIVIGYNTNTKKITREILIDKIKIYKEMENQKTKKEAY